MKILIIQTAFIGDVVLATSLLESLHKEYPDAVIDFVLRKGNEGLLKGHPFLREVIVFNKKQGKYKELRRIIKKARLEQYDYAINVQRFFTTGLLTALSGAKVKIGFDKNPMSWAFQHRAPHEISTEPHASKHEIERNHALISTLTSQASPLPPKLYPSDDDYKAVPENQEYVCLAPASVWFTKQLPEYKWEELIESLPKHLHLYLIGGPGDKELCNRLKKASSFPSEKIHVLAGKISFLESVALIENAKMTYANDSAPMHFASAVNAPITAVFCSTVPSFGFGPLSDRAAILEAKQPLPCRPCGLHGKKACPKGHFKCSEIDMQQVKEQWQQ